MVVISIDSNCLQHIICGFLAHEHTTNDLKVLRTVESASGADWIIDKALRDNVDDCITELGIGSFTFVWNGAMVELKRWTIGNPVATHSPDKEASVLEHLTLNTDALNTALDIVKAAKMWQENRVDGKVQIFRWCANSEFWRREAQICTRSFDTIILDDALKRKLLQDIQDFNSDETRAFYARHCIPFRRGILLHGPPGTGKSSIIHAIASLFQRPIHRINLVAPKLCDDSLQAAINRADAEALIVMEDIDALFGVHREKTESFNVTFSGLLNAIDGVNDTTKGALFVFTTNHPEKLDAALKRKGRIDLEFRVGYCTIAQARQMFLRFYPGETASAEAFCQALRGHSAITPAQLQHHFLEHRLSAAQEAAKITIENNDNEHATLFN